MVRWLNKKLLFALLFGCFTLNVFTQEGPDSNHKDYKDYKDKEQFEKFYKRRTTVGAWQIDQLKQGALVVRLKTNKKVIKALLANGQTDLAEQKATETYLVNRNLMLAYLNNFNFCKVYFINSNYSDSLLNGARSGIFLDTTMQVNPSIVMREKFYMLAERDFVYNSSIGFVPEDSARYVIESGNPVNELGIVIKNKYGQQVKAPFPRGVDDKVFTNALVGLPFVVLSPVSIWVYVDISPPGDKPEYTSANKKKYSANVKKQYTYQKLSSLVQRFNRALENYYSVAPRISEATIDRSIKPFLY